MLIYIFIHKIKCFKADSFLFISVIMNGCILNVKKKNFETEFMLKHKKQLFEISEFGILVDCIFQHDEFWFESTYIYHPAYLANKKLI